MSFFKALILFAGLTAASILPVAQPIESRANGQCTSADFVPTVKTGRPSGAAFCESAWGGSYLPITNITFWFNNVYITGLQATYSDGSQGVIQGAKAASTKTIGVDYATNDYFVGLYTWGRESSNGLVRRVRIRTSKGAYEAGGDVVNVSEPVPGNTQDVGSGVLYGLIGTIDSNNVLVSLGFVFLNSAISEIQVQNVTFPSGFLGTSQGIAPTALQTAHYYNSDVSGNITWTFTNTLTLTNSYMFSQAYTQTFTTSQAIMFSAMLSIPMIGSIGGGETTTYTWTSTTTDTDSTTVTTSFAVGYNEQGTIGPGQGVDCSALAGQGSGTFPYNSVVTITLKNGNKYTFPESGKLTLKAVSQATVSVKQANHP